MVKANINLENFMDIDFIIQKGQTGKTLSTKEIEALMLHAIDLLKFIEKQTHESIERAHKLLESQYRKAA